MEKGIIMLERKTIEQEEGYLRQKSKPVDFATDDWKQAYQKLDYFCKNDDNVLAMASVQIGIPLRMVYLKKTDLERLDEEYNEEKVLINPVVLKRVGLTRYWEACASCLDYTGLVERPYKMLVEYFDLEGKRHREWFEGFVAIVVSHELDHLEGILHIDIALEVLWMDVEQRKKWRKEHPYQIIRKTGEYINGKKNVVKKKCL